MFSAMTLSLFVPFFLFGCCTGELYHSRKSEYESSVEITAAVKRGDLKVYEDSSAYYADISGGKGKLPCFKFNKKAKKTPVQEWVIDRFELNFDSSRIKEVAAKSAEIYKYEIAIKPENALLLDSQTIKTIRNSYMILIVEPEDDMIVLSAYSDGEDGAPWIERSWIKCQATKSYYLLAFCADIALSPLEAIFIPIVITHH